MTIPLQQYLKRKNFSYGEESDRNFCWDLHIITLQGRSSLLAVHCPSLYTFTLFALNPWDWDDLAGSLVKGIQRRFRCAGYDGIGTAQERLLYS